MKRIPIPKPGERSLKKRDENDDELDKHSDSYAPKVKITMPGKGHSKRDLKQRGKGHKINQK